MHDIVLETGQPGIPGLSTRLVRSREVLRELPSEQPAVLLAYASGASRAHRARIEVMRALARARWQLSVADARRFGIHVLELHDEWRKELEVRIRDLGTGTVLCVVNRNASGSRKTPTTPLARAKVRRDHILATGNWLTAAQVAEHVNGSVAVSNPSQYASRLRRQRRLLGVRHRGEYVHPEFQFDSRTGQLDARMTQLLAILPKDSSGWGPAFWCFQPRRSLDDRSPADIFGTEPDRVIAAAKQDFEGDDAGW